MLFDSQLLRQTEANVAILSQLVTAPWVIHQLEKSTNLLYINMCIRIFVIVHDDG